MSSAVLPALAGVIMVSSLGLIGMFTLSWSEKTLQRSMPKLIAIAAGVLIGEACFHLIPDSLDHGSNALTTGILVALGVGISWLIEAASRLTLRRSNVSPIARISLISESVHNAVDGAIIAGAFLAGPKVGVYATLAIIIHEIPHELGNFAILVHAGYERIKALKLNLLSAGCAVLGAMAVFFLPDSALFDAAWILPVAAGCFLYMAIIDLVPNLWQTQKMGGRASIGYGVSAGLAIMLLLARGH